MTSPKFNKLEESESFSDAQNLLYNSFKDSLVGVAIFKGKTHIFEFVNAAYEKIIDREIIIGKPARELFPEIEQQGYWQILDNVFDTGEPFLFNELPVDLKRKKDGILEKRYLNLVIQPLSDESGKTERILVHVTDVSRQIEARSQINDREDKFHNILLQAPGLNTTFKGREFIVTTVNKMTLEIWGKSYEEIINRPIFESSPELEDSLAKILNEVYATGEPFIANESPVQLTRNGKLETAYFNSVYQPLRDSDNTINGIILIGTEITESVIVRRQIEASELFNRTVLESSPDCLKVLDTEGRIQFMNFNGLCHMEIDDFSNYKDRSWWTIWGSENEGLVRESVDKALKGEIGQFTAFCPTAKGTPKWWDVLVSPVGKPGDPVQQIISVSRDITEQKKSQEALDKINQMLDLKNRALEEANAELKSFSYIASHDLQEPLRMIKLFSQRILESEKFSEKTQTDFNFIISASERMRNLITSLIDFSRIDSSELHFGPCDLNTIVEESKNDLQLSINEKQARIEYQNLPTINGMHVQLSQLFTNIISNAIKYSRSEVTPHIKITSQYILGEEVNHPEANKQTEYCIIKFEDNGIGFKKDFAIKIFEAFRRLHGKNEYSGTGIGLSIVKKIVTNHNGLVVAEGTPGLGSIFTIYLPRE
ncbi:PAS domain-containing protein [Algoriphagus sp. C2-6-M1]|uniref:PAS domain-containing sensor histidine kinase n=1 Tax=Algoriphagus persicinus TaxID=3108754 RepID=UPI002B3E7B0F|nr:PAS domain-containing protein [Algoriphagus sp. C2-6-M1]MEB2782611.1 PAS domain-containing protein [Algoriphagus sp. C2-6-M1]